MSLKNEKKTKSAKVGDKKKRQKKYGTLNSDNSEGMPPAFFDAKKSSKNKIKCSKKSSKKSPQDKRHVFDVSPNSQPSISLYNKEEKTTSLDSNFDTPPKVGVRKNAIL